jgi:hypothetical protein
MPIRQTVTCSASALDVFCIGGGGAGQQTDLRSVAGIAWSHVDGLGTSALSRLVLTLHTTTTKRLGLF